jgi:hypothetical protein
MTINLCRYSDDQFEYRHVQLPKNMLKKIPADYFDASKGTLKLLWEEEWRALGITQVLSLSIFCWTLLTMLFTMVESRMGTLRMVDTVSTPSLHHQSY